MGNLDVLCVECGDPIPSKRLQVIKTEMCVGCAEDLESQGLGTKKRRMEVSSVVMKNGEIEDISFHIVKPS